MATIACNRLTVADVEDDADLRQLGYLAVLARRRVGSPEAEAAVDRFVSAVSGIRNGKPVPAPERTVDRLHARWGAAYGLDIGKLRSELPVYLRAEQRRASS